MSKEEILKNINEMIELIDAECYISIPEDIESIKGLLDLYTKLQKENKEAYHKGFIDGITSSKYIIGNKIKELDDSCSIEGDIGIIYLKELLEMMK